MKFKIILNESGNISVNKWYLEQYRIITQYLREALSLPTGYINNLNYFEDQQKDKDVGNLIYENIDVITRVMTEKSSLDDIENILKDDNDGEDALYYYLNVSKADDNVYGALPMLVTNTFIIFTKDNEHGSKEINITFMDVSNSSYEDLYLLTSEGGVDFNNFDLNNEEHQGFKEILESSQVFTKEILKSHVDRLYVDKDPKKIKSDYYNKSKLFNTTQLPNEIKVKVGIQNLDESGLFAQATIPYGVPLVPLKNEKQEIFWDKYKTYVPEINISFYIDSDKYQGEENWRGLYSGKGNLDVKFLKEYEGEDEYLYTLEVRPVEDDDLYVLFHGDEDAFMHELEHDAQAIMTRILGMSDYKDGYGGPTRKVKRRQQDGGGTEWSSEKHELRNVEFQTRLNDTIRSLKFILNRYGDGGNSTHEDLSKFITENYWLNYLAENEPLRFNLAAKKIYKTWKDEIASSNK